MAGAKPRATLPPVITASRWGTAFDAAWSRILDAHGSGLPITPPLPRDQFGIPAPPAPRLTNGEAIALIAGWHDAATHRFPLWYQYAAVAYGWDPENDNLDTSPSQAAKAYMPDEVNAALWGELFQVASALDGELDAAENMAKPRIDLDTAFNDPVFAGKVAAQLKADGADAAFKIPTGRCRDRRTGKKRLYRPCPPGAKQGADGRWYYKDPITGAQLVCDGKGDCDPELVDDPITHARKQLFTLALIVGAVWWLSKRARNPRRRRRN